MTLLNYLEQVVDGLEEQGRKKDERINLLQTHIKELEKEINSLKSSK